MSTDDDGEHRASDVPLDLAKEREAFVRSFLKKGVEYTELLLKENTELREELESAMRANARLRAQVASDDAIRDLLRTVERLETERSELLDRSTKLERVEAEVTLRQQTIEQDLNNLANLYIATFQLHASLSPRRVVRHLRDMMGQLVGAYGFVIYLIDEASRKAVPVAFEGLEEAEVASVALGSGPVGEACLTGLRFVKESELHDGSDEPRALIPMMVDGRAIGVVEVRTVLEQKTEWVSLDHELFELVGAQAGVAMIAANLYDSAAGPVSALQGFVEKQQR
ncbi:MAG: GAF domain-containing protein [Myxococcota bacterium]